MMRKTVVIGPQRILVADMGRDSFQLRSEAEAALAPKIPIDAAIVAGIARDQAALFEGLRRQRGAASR